MREIMEVPFLPVNPDYSATRNQGRQKLARLTHAEFAALVLDVLKEIRRRQVEIDTARGVVETSSGISRLGVRNNCSSGLSDDEPLYDSVASDDDYYTIQDRGEEARASLGANGRGVSEALDGASGMRSASSLSTAASTLQRSKSLAAAD